MESWLANKRIILASGSPRRHHLLKELGVDFEIKTKPVDEDFSSDMPAREVAPYLAAIKSNAFDNDLDAQDLLITADTTVVLKDTVINKPTDRIDAIKMLQRLSGNMHTVVTGVTLRNHARSITFKEETDVYFSALSTADIEYYVDRYEPYDKAGSYGIQEWIGYVGVERINGCFFNVMGLPLHRLYAELKLFTQT